MTDNPLSPIDPVTAALARTPARVLVGRAGTAYRTTTALQLRADHAAARDAIHDEVDLLRDFGPDRINGFLLFIAKTQAGSKAEYLRRPDLGRKLDDDSRELIRSRCPAGADLQVVIGDGLSATAVASQAPALLDGLWAAAQDRGWSFGRPFLVTRCRVGVMNDIGELLQPKVVVLLIGERPGLATAESLSAYLAFQPRHGHTDADRNLISNIHSRGVPATEAVTRIAALAETMMRAGRGGVAIKEGVTSTTRELTG